LNEEANAVGAIETIMSAVARVGCSYEILGFDDGSQDKYVGGRRGVLSGKSVRPVRLVCNKVNGGLAYNFVEGALQGWGRYYRSLQKQSRKSFAPAARPTSFLPASWKFETDRFGARSYRSCIPACQSCKLVPASIS
jgi:hypothetical protein